MTWLRPATLADANDLFAWRNDPVTLACFRSTAVVPREDHDRWMKFNVLYGYPEHIVLIAENESEPVGVVRFDSVKDDVMSYEASITMAPKYRGNGLSKTILDTACRAMDEFTINAEIRKDNAASRKIFERCGFREIKSDNAFITYRRGPLS
jgi:UDP-2,4-diacetamido-2,4,6-trideoxy-beta-L-altropyranose hydrolase